MLLLQNRDSANHMGYHFFKSLTLFAYMIAFVETDLSGVGVARRCPELCSVP